MRLQAEKGDWTGRDGFEGQRCLPAWPVPTRPSRLPACDLSLCPAWPARLALSTPSEEATTTIFLGCPLHSPPAVTKQARPPLLPPKTSFPPPSAGRGDGGGAPSQLTYLRPFYYSLLLETPSPQRSRAADVSSPILVIPLPIPLAQHQSCRESCTMDPVNMTIYIHSEILDSWFVIPP